MRDFTTPEAVHVLAENWPALARLRGELLDELFTRIQRLEASLVLTEDQRDKGIAERDALRNQLDDLQAGMRQWEDEHASAVASVIAERDNLRKQLDNMKADYRDGSYWVIQ